MLVPDGATTPRLAHIGSVGCLLLATCQGTIVRPAADGDPVAPADGQAGERSADGSGPMDGPGPADRPGSDARGPCNDNEAHLAGYCYRAVGMGAMTYQVAADACTVIDALPVSIHSAEENDLVYSLLYMWTECAWIGMARQGGEPVWVDGTPVDYANWQAGRPASDACFCIGGPMASTQNQGRWRDMRCGAQLREIVCKRKL